MKVMKKGFWIFVLLFVFVFSQISFAQESTTLFTFESLNEIKLLNTDGTTGKDSVSPATYSNGILTLSSHSAENLFLVEGKVPETVDRFTIHVEFSVPVYTESQTLEAIILLGETRHTFNHHRFEIKDSVRGDTADRPVYVRYQRRSVNDYLEVSSQKATQATFNSGEWISVDLLVDETNRTVSYYVDGALVETINNVNVTALPLDGRIGFRGKGVSFRNLIVSNGLIVPTLAAPTPSVTVTPSVTATPLGSATPNSPETTPGAGNPITSDSTSLYMLVGICFISISVISFFRLRKNNPGR